jgi:hypothetical protein
MIRRWLLVVAAALLVLVSALGLSGSASERHGARHGPRPPLFVDHYQPALPSADEIDPPGLPETPAVTR